MTMLSFLVKGSDTEQHAPMAWVTVEERGNGSLFFKVKQIGGVMGNLHGVYFDVTDETILNTLTIRAISRDSCIYEDSITGMKNGTDPVPSFAARPTQSVAEKEGTRTYSFTLQSRNRSLVLSDFSCMQLDYSNNPYDCPNIKSNDDNSHRWLYLALL